jgi:hypothetical protein
VVEKLQNTFFLADFDPGTQGKATSMAKKSAEKTRRSLAFSDDKPCRGFHASEPDTLSRTQFLQYITDTFNTCMRLLLQYRIQPQPQAHTIRQVYVFYASPVRARSDGLLTSMLHSIGDSKTLPDKSIQVNSMPCHHGIF